MGRLCLVRPRPLHCATHRAPRTSTAPLRQISFCQPHSFTSHILSPATIFSLPLHGAAAAKPQPSPSRRVRNAPAPRCRRTDDIVDKPRKGGGSSLRDELDEWRARLSDVWRGRAHDLLDLALVDTVQKYPELTIEPFEDMVKGMVMDLDQVCRPAARSRTARIANCTGDCAPPRTLSHRHCRHRIVSRRSTSSTSTAIASLAQSGS